MILALLLLLTADVETLSANLGVRSVEQILPGEPAVEGDEEFTPTGPNKWTEERLAIKLANLAKVISKTRARLDYLLDPCFSIASQRALAMDCIPLSPGWAATPACSNLRSARA